MENKDQPVTSYLVHVVAEAETSAMLPGLALVPCFDGLWM